MHGIVWQSPTEWTAGIVWIRKGPVLGHGSEELVHQVFVALSLVESCFI
jgi:hypothetical protein